MTNWLTKRQSRVVRVVGFRPRLEPLEDRLTPVTWPVTAPAGSDVHQMYNGFGAGRPAGDNFGFHEGIDVWVDGEGGANQKVVAARAGEIVRLTPVFASGGRVTIKVAVGVGMFEYDDYLHMDPKAGLALNQQVLEGAEIGSIATLFPAGRRHLHMSVLSAIPPLAGPPAENTILNPFLRFTANADRDPLGYAPKLADTNDDNRKLIVTRSGTVASISKQTVDGDIDIIADARDQMNTTLLPPSSNPISNPYAAGYWINPLFDKGVVVHGVKTANAPYLLAKFDDNWFKGTNTVPAIKTSAKAGEVYDLSRQSDLPAPHSARYNHFLLTNTNGTTGSINNVDANQYWNTNAKDDGAVDTVAHADFAGKPDATGNAEGRFKDGGSHSRPGSPSGGLSLRR
jgi:hypothetical protein